MSVFDILEGAKFAETTVEICLRQDLDLRIRELTDRQSKILRALNRDDDARLGHPELSGDDQRELELVNEELEQLEAEMAASVLTFHLRGVSTTEYNVLQRSAGRPRKDNKVDQAVGYNVQSFFEKAAKRCTYKVTAPDGSQAQFADEHWTKLLESISDAQFDLLCQGVDEVNRQVARVPSKARSSEDRNGSEPKLQQPTGLGSLTSGSSDGNPSS